MMQTSKAIFKLINRTGSQYMLTELGCIRSSQLGEKVNSYNKKFHCCSH